MNRIRSAVFLEMLAFFGIIAAIGIVFNHGNFAFTGSLLHPFLLVIAFIAISHGLTEALLATAFAAILYFFGGPTPGDGGPHGKIIFAFVLTGVSLGLAMHNRNRQLAQARSELEEMRNEAERVRQRLQVVNAANQKLNERILGEVNTIQNFSEIARRLSVLEEKDIYPAVCDLVRDFLKANEASVYMRDGDALVLTAQRGWESVPRESLSIFRGKDLLWTALDAGKAVTAMELDLQSIDADEPSRRYKRLMCAPITHPTTHKTVGVVSVDQLPFSEFHGNNLSVLGVIAKWAGDSLYNAANFQELASQLAADELMPLSVSPVVFRDRINQEGNTGFVSATIQGLAGLSDKSQVSVREGLYSAIQPLLGNKDVLGRLKPGVYGILLPADQTGQFVQKLAQKVQQSFQDHPEAGKVSILVGQAKVESDDDIDNLLRTSKQNLIRC